VSGEAPAVPFRLILHPPMEGRLDMAIDEALADAVGAARSPAVVRLYGFSPPTLSLGRFQKVNGRLDAGLLAADGVTLVRRPTGGHAVLHDQELTYSVILPKQGGPLPGAVRKRDVYRYIAAVLLAGLERLGVRGMVYEARQGDARNPDCFGSAGEYEIGASGGRKLIGSAQMTTRRAVLQHGSIPLVNPGSRVLRYIAAEQPTDAQPPTSLAEELGRPVSFAEAQAAFAAAARACLAAGDSALRPEEEEAARGILARTYASDAWNLSC
jgi:lipoyl(octanoyl) transferase